MMLYRLARPFLFGLDPELAHRMTISVLQGLPNLSPRFDPRVASMARLA
jgi:hypothetical protein